MSRAPQLPVSALIKQGKGLDEEDQATKRRRNDFRELKELEEQRKAGTAPAMVDCETGRDINPHIPEFIEKTPWYVETDGPTLKHQRPHPERATKFAKLDEWYRKGTTGKVAFKFRKGACENCGAMGHKKKECLERPRSIGAKYTEKDIAPDDFVQPNLSLNYDSKRDRWNGYDPASHTETVVKEFENMAEIAKIMKAEKIKKGELDPEAPEDDAAGDDDEKYADEMNPASSVDLDSRTRITVRNLRIREDPAKYLLNLNENGPYYDPKSRSMRENPFLGVKGKEVEAAKFAGENYTRYTGEVIQANQAQVFAWSARSKGIDVNAMAEPTKLEVLQKNFDKERAEMTETAKKSLIEKYGGEEHLEAPAKELLLAQTEQYVEYNRKGKLIKGEKRPLLKTKYDEDLLINNHTSVWGSYWREGKWGYKCCHSLLKNSYCVGEKGYALEKELFTRVAAPKPTPVAPVVEPETSTPAPAPAKKAESSKPEKTSKKKRSKSESSSSSSDSSSESEAESESEKQKGPAEELDSEAEREYQKQIEAEKKEEKERKERRDHKRKMKREKRKRQKERRRETREKEGPRHSRKRKASPSSSSSESESEDDVSAKKKKKHAPELSAAIKKIRKEMKEGKELAGMDDRDRGFHSQYETKKMTEVELEAYNLMKIHSSDPMASLMK
uniref:Pre-mRNA-splicing factor SLU7 n=1 Tax=Panagrellus redivivus TaxID=6233 RepID=A0A7E4URA1_PANRE